MKIYRDSSVVKASVTPEECLPRFLNTLDFLVELKILDHLLIEIIRPVCGIPKVGFDVSSEKYWTEEFAQGEESQKAIAYAVFLVNLFKNLPRYWVTTFHFLILYDYLIPPAVGVYKPLLVTNVVPVQNAIRISFELYENISKSKLVRLLGEKYSALRDNLATLPKVKNSVSTEFREMGAIFATRYSEGTVFVELDLYKNLSTARLRKLLTSLDLEYRSLIAKLPKTPNARLKNMGFLKEINAQRFGNNTLKSFAEISSTLTDDTRFSAYPVREDAETLSKYNTRGLNYFAYTTEFNLPVWRAFLDTLSDSQLIDLNEKFGNP